MIIHNGKIVKFMLNHVKSSTGNLAFQATNYEGFRLEKHDFLVQTATAPRRLCSWLRQSFFEPAAAFGCMILAPAKDIGQLTSHLRLLGFPGI
jgi:hypothetical protein